MDYLVSPNSQVVLVLKEGNGFSFLTTGLIAVASLKGIKLETKEIQSSSRPQFHSELIWELNSKYLRKLRSSNTALKIEFYLIITNSERRERIGYILLNLKEAQIVKSSNQNGTVSSHRLLNLKSSYQTHKPEVLLQFMIVESPIKNFMSTDNDKEESPMSEANPDLVGEENVFIGAGEQMGIDSDLKPLQIGPPPLCTELYQLSISFLQVENLSHITPVDKIGRPIKIHFAIFGLSIWTNDISSLENRDHTEITTFQIWSKVEFISAYFKEFSSLVLTIYCDEEVIGIASLDLQHLGSTTLKKNTAINSCITIKPQNEYENMSDILLPTLQVGVTLLHQNDCIITRHDQECQTNDAQPSKSIDAVTNTENQPECCNYESGGVEHPSNKENLVILEDVEHGNVSNRSINTQHKHKAFIRTPKTVSPDAFDHISHSRTPTYRLSNVSISQVPELPKEYVREAAIRACEELEEWKEKQQEMFEFELKQKTEKRLKKLSNEWIKRKQVLEEELSNKIEACESLKDRLSLALDDYNQRTETLIERERELQLAQEELERKYTQKFQALRKASKLHEYDMEDRINEVKSENSELLKRLEEREKEIVKLQETLLKQEVPRITKEDANNLLSEVKSLEKKLEKALESKAFFKEQWGKAVRELHRMKEAEQQHLQQQIQKNKKELQTLGLVKEIGEEVSEMKKDQSAIKNLRNNLSAFISSSGPIVDCLSGT